MIQKPFTFGNNAFLKLWNLPENFFDTAPHYNTFLDTIREAKILPEVPDFKQYKEEENKAFDALTETHEDLLYIPDGRTFRRLRAPHPDGTIIAYEDITDRLAISRKLDDLQSVQKSILENINDAVLIFSPALKLNYCNNAYEKLWNTSSEELAQELPLKEVLDKQKKLLPELDDWQNFREDMQKHITACTPFTLKLKNKLEELDKDVTLFNAIYVKPFDTSKAHELLNYKKVIIYNAYATKEGFANALEAYLLDNKYRGDVVIRTVPTKFVKQATIEEQREEFGLAIDEIIDLI